MQTHALMTALTTARQRRVAIVNALLVAIDASAAAFVVTTQGAVLEGVTPFRVVLMGIVAAATLPALIAALGGYDERRRHDGRVRSAGRIALATAAVVWGTPILSGSVESVAPVVAVFGWLGLTALIVGARLATAAWESRLRDRIVLVGSGEVASHIATLVRRHPERNAEVIGFVDDEDRGPPGLLHLGRIDELPDVVRRNAVDRVVVSFSRTGDSRIMSSVRACAAMPVRVDVVPRLFELVAPGPVWHRIGGLAMVELTGPRRLRGQGLVKRLFDISVASVLLVLTAPLWAAIAIAIRLDDGAPILFRQERIGQGGRTFRICKFRTMRVDAESILAADGADDGNLADRVRRQKERGDAQVTRTGRTLRRLSLDELPQLWNVLLGDMSIVGPRPLVSFEVAGLDLWQHRRHAVRPGITGSWQVLGRSEIGWSERMELDVSYAQHWSLAEDFAILVRTAIAVTRRRGAR